MGRLTAPISTTESYADLTVFTELTQKQLSGNQSHGACSCHDRHELRKVESGAYAILEARCVCCVYKRVVLLVIDSAHSEGLQDRLD